MTTAATRNEIVVYSGRNRPDLAPVYQLFTVRTGTAVRVEKIYHRDVGTRLLEERSEPRADILLTNSQIAIEPLRAQGMFEPYASPVARDYDVWLRAPDFGWLSFTAWPRVAMVNRSILGDDPARWPHRIEDLAEPRFRDRVTCASLVEATTVAYFAAIRVARGDVFAEQLIRGMRDNGLRVHRSNIETREALLRDRLAVALANASNVHVFRDEGQPVSEAWLDQDAGELGTHVEAHTVALIRGARNPDGARDFIDFLLTPAVQAMLAALYGETPVNSLATHGSVVPLARIRRIDAPLAEVVARVGSTIELLRRLGFGE